MREGGYFAARSDFDARFLLLQGLEPTMPPAPEPDLALHDRVGFFQADFSLQEDLGFVVVEKHRSVAIVRRRDFQLGEEFLRQRKRTFARDLEVDRCLREGQVEVPNADVQARYANEQTGQNEAIVSSCEFFLHGLLVM